MRRYPEDAWERAMKVQEVILRAMARRITWWVAAATGDYWNLRAEHATLAVALRALGL